MPQYSASFRSEIKACEQRLVSNPDSFCFARLADIYLKVGLVDDALRTARQGVARHPDYVAGQRALAFACHARGLMDECRQALELVTRAVPEDREALKMLARLQAEAGNGAEAVAALQTLLDFDAGDEECRLHLEALERGAPLPGPPARREDTAPDIMDAGFAPFDDDVSESAMEDIEIIDMDESDLIEEGDWDVADRFMIAPGALPGEVPQDPLTTSTMAELYVQQGFVARALDIYRAILADNPALDHVRQRIAELETAEPAGCGDEGPVRAASEEPPGFAETTSHGEVPPAAPEAGTSSATVAVLEEWLENIKKVRPCR